MCTTGANLGSQRWLVAKQFCTIERSWRHEERCTAILFGSTLVMAVYAPDSSKDVELYEACVSNVLRRVLREGRRGGAEQFYITGDPNGELEMICTDENDIEELNEMYGPLCWREYDHDLGGLQKIMWYSIMKEFICNVSSTWSNDDLTKDAALTHSKHGDGGQEKVSQLDFIIGPTERQDDCHICNEGKVWDSWDHFPVHARIQEGRDAEQFTKKRKEWAWMGTQDVEHKIDFMKKVMENDVHGGDEKLATIQKTIEFAAGNVAHCTKAERKKVKRTRDDARTREEAAVRCTKAIKRRVLKKQARKAGAEHLVRCCLALGKKEASRKPLTEFCRRAFY